VPYRSVNPATEDVLNTFHKAHRPRNDGRSGYRGQGVVVLGTRPIEERATVLSSDSQLLHERKSDLAMLATLEMDTCVATERVKSGWSTLLMPLTSPSCKHSRK
jgi:acyl-CoA reductase-like NAD-dependent aldehyde dehydrogenase